MIKIVFFANLREQLGCGELTLADFTGATIADVLAQLLLLHPEWTEFFNDKKILLALNQTMAHWNSPVAPHDEVAFFPPVTGG